MKSKIFFIFIFILVTRALGIVFLPILIQFSPLLLIILSPFIHHLILASSQVEAPTFLTTGIIISLFQCTAGYEFGRRYGNLAREWSKNNHLITESKFKILQNWLQFSAPFVLFTIPGPIVAMVAGISLLRKKIFFISMIPSQIIWIFACYYLGLELNDYIILAKQFIQNHWAVLTLIFCTLKAIHSWRKKSLL